MAALAACRSAHRQSQMIWSDGSGGAAAAAAAAAIQSSPSTARWSTAAAWIRGRCAHRPACYLRVSASAYAWREASRQQQQRRRLGVRRAQQVGGGIRLGRWAHCSACCLRVSAPAITDVVIGWQRWRGSSSSRSRDSKFSECVSATIQRHHTRDCALEGHGPSIPRTPVHPFPCTTRVTAGRAVAMRSGGYTDIEELLRHHHGGYSPQGNKTANP